MSYPKDFLKELSAERKQQIKEELIQSVESACHKLLLETAIYREALAQGKPTAFAEEQVRQELDNLEKANIAFRDTLYLLRRLPS